MLRTTGAVLVGLVVLTNSVSADPNFRPRRDFGSEQVRAPGPLVVADFNGDELRDVAVGNTGSDGVTVLINDGKGSFRFYGIVRLIVSSVIVSAVQCKNAAISSGQVAVTA